MTISAGPVFPVTVQNIRGVRLMFFIGYCFNCKSFHALYTPVGRDIKNDGN